MQIDHPDSKAQCNRPGCDCSVAAGQEEFCSEHCRSAARKEPGSAQDRSSCACGHAECNASERRTTS